MTNLLDHLRPTTLAQLIAELIADHTEEMDVDEFNFMTEAAKNAYSELLAAGLHNCGEREFFCLVETAVDRELAKK